MRVTRDEPWKPRVPVAAAAEPVVGRRSSNGASPFTASIPSGTAGRRTPRRRRRQAFARKIARQSVKDYVVVPRAEPAPLAEDAGANVTANLLRNLWAYVVIFCGHFPDGAEKFTADVLAGGNPGRVVPAADARRRELQSRSVAGILERQPVLPDRAPPVSRPAEQPLCADRRAGAGAVREVRPAVHDRFAGAPVPADAAHHQQTRTARPIPDVHLRRCAGNRLGADVHGRRHVAPGSSGPRWAPDCVAGARHRRHAVG